MDGSNTVLCMSIIIIMIIIVVGVGVNINEVKEKNHKDHLARISKVDEIGKYYSTIMNSIDIPDKSSLLVYKSGTNTNFDLLRGTVYCWKNNTDLCFFPDKPNYDNIVEFTEDNIKIVKISIDQIEYFSTRGEQYRETKISGGGGGGSSLGGAIVGGAIAGGAGAIIGSRKGVESIKSEVVTHDTRETYINYFDDNGQRQSLVFDISAQQALNDLIPEKEYEIVSAIKTNDLIHKEMNKGEGTSIVDQIRELAKLKDEGILTEQEFAEKKSQLLDKIQ
jgi:hypothetical protein